MIKHNDYCIILAGGSGKRLWPVSRQIYPKQFMDLFGIGRSLLQQTYDRFAEIIPPEHIFVATYAGYVDLVMEQLPELRRDQILEEPVQLSTAPPVAWAAFHIEQIDPKANIIVSPADQIIINQERFKEDVREGLNYVEDHEEILALGAKPTMPNTSYGYIQKGELTSEEAPIYKVKSFSEKPSEEYAKMFVDCGEFVWNTGLFLCQLPTLTRRLEQLMPEVAEHWREEKRVLTAEEERRLINQYYPASLRISIDLVILERSSNVCVRECDFGWADVGSWDSVRNVMKKDVDGNAVDKGAISMLTNCKDNVVSVPNGTLVCLKDLSGYLVAMQQGVIVVCPNNNTDILRTYINQAQMDDEGKFV